MKAGREREDNTAEVSKVDHAHIWANEHKALMVWIGVRLGCCGGSQGCGVARACVVRLKTR